jgi:hypothetical protein
MKLSKYLKVLKSVDRAIAPGEKIHNQFNPLDRRTYIYHTHIDWKHIIHHVGKHINFDSQNPQ